MPFIGQQPTTGAFLELDSLTASATANYTLQLNGANYYPESVNNLLVSINGVIQGSSTMSLSGAVLTVGATLSASDVIDFVRVFGNVGTISTPTDGSVTANKIGTGAVNLTTKVTGVLPVANGGTGHNSVVAFACKHNLSSGSDVGVTGTVVFNNVQVNIGSAYDNSNGRFTAPVAGTYSFSFYALACQTNGQGLSGSTSTVGYFYKNGSDVGYGRIQVSNVAGYPNIASSIVITLAENEYIQVHMASNGVLTSVSNNYNQFSGHLIG